MIVIEFTQRLPITRLQFSHATGEWVLYSTNLHLIGLAVDPLLSALITLHSTTNSTNIITGFLSFVPVRMNTRCEPWY